MTWSEMIASDNVLVWAAGLAGAAAMAATDWRSPWRAAQHIFVGTLAAGFATPVAPTPAQAIRSYQQGYQGGLGFPTAPDGPNSQGGLTAYGEAASRGDFGGQAQTAADNPGKGLY